MKLRTLDRPIRNIHKYLVGDLRTKRLKTQFVTPCAPLGARKRIYDLSHFTSALTRPPDAMLICTYLLRHRQ